MLRLHLDLCMYCLVITTLRAKLTRSIKSWIQTEKKESYATDGMILTRISQIYPRFIENQDVWNSEKCTTVQSGIYINSLVRHVGIKNDVFSEFNRFIGFASKTQGVLLTNV